MAKDIHNAAGYGNVNEVTRFLERGISVDATDHEGATPLARAARFNHVDVAELLVTEGATVDYQDDSGRTPLHLAAATGRLEVLNFLIGAGANRDATEKRGETPLMYAAAQGQYFTGEALIQNGANVNARDNEGFTALIHSLLICGGDYKQRFELIRLLISSDADVGQKGNEGKTAVQIAEEIDRDPELIAMLQEAAGLPVTVRSWDTIGGANCVLCSQLKRWKPSKRHPDYIRPDVVEDWMGMSLPGRIKFASGTVYRGNHLIKFEILQAWHEEWCSEAEGT